MEAENAASEKEADSSADTAAKAKVLHRSAPSRQKFEKDLAEIKTKIEAIDEQLQKINGTGQNTPQYKLQQIKDKRETANTRRKQIISQLDELKKQIDTKRDAASQMRSKLQYQSEQQIEDLARKLELQLQQHSFRLAEERRLVAEIDRLRRSKKAVRQYNEAKDELTKLRESQQSLRVERDSISSEFSAYRSQEDEIHGGFKKNKELVENLKKELSILHERKRNCVADFKEEQSRFVEFRDQKRAEISKLRQQEKQAINQAKAEERRELLNSIKPYEEERQLCATLLSFLGKMELQTPSTPSSSCYSSYANTPMSPDEPKSPLPLVRDEAEDKLLSGMESLYCGIPRRSSKKVKRSGSKASQYKKRPLTLTPDLLVQFDKIGIKVPVTAIDIPPTIEAIKAQQKLYNRMTAAEMAERAAKSSSNNLQRNGEEEGTPPAEKKLAANTLTLPLFSFVSAFSDA